MDRTARASRSRSAHRRTRAGAGLLAGALTLGGLVGAAQPAAAAAPTLRTSVSVSNTTPMTGEPFTTTVGYSCASATTDCLNTVLSVTLPAALDPATSITTTPHVKTAAYSAATRKVTWTFLATLPAGASGQVSFTTDFTQGPTPNGATAVMKSTMTASNAASKTSNPVTVTAVVNNPWLVQKAVTTAGPVTGNSSYAVKVCRGAAVYGQINLLDGVVTDTVPAGATFVSASNGGTWNAGPGTVTWTLGATAAAAQCTATLTLTLNFPSPPFSSGQSVTNKASGTGHVPGGAGPVVVSFGNAAASHVLAPLTGAFQITKTAGQGQVVAGQPMSWTVTVKNIGTVALAPFWTDVFPQGESILPGGRIGIGNTAGARVDIYISVQTNPRRPAVWHRLATGPFTGVDVNNSVTTAPNPLPGNAAGITGLKYVFLDNLAVGASAAVRNDVLFSGVDDTGKPIPNGTTLQNCATVTWSYNGQQTANACANASAAAPNPVVSVSKAANGALLVPGQLMPWTVTATNTGNVPETWSTTDILPVGLSIKPNGTIAYGATAGLQVKISYSVKRNPRSNPAWTLLGTFGPGVASTDHTTAPSSLPGNAPYITALKYDFTAAMPMGGSWAVQNPTFFSDLDDTGAALSAGTVVQNCATVTSTYGATQKSGTGCASLTITPTIDIRASKNVGASYPTPNVGSNVTFPLAMASTTNSWYAVTDPVIADVVPPQAGPSGASWASSFVVTNAAGTAFNAASDFSATAMSGGRTALRWQFHGTLQPNTTISISLTVTALFAPAYTNYDDHIWTGGTMQITPICPYSVALGGLGVQQDAENVLGFGASYKACHSKWGFQIAPVAALNSTALVHGQLDPSYVQYPTVGQSVPGGLADYRLQVTNTGTVTMKNIVVVDVLPWVGDTEVLSSTPRGSQYHPNLAGPVQTSDPNITVYYSTQTDPCEAAIGIVASCVNAGWSTTPPADITRVASVKFTTGSLVLAPGAVFQLDWPMRVPNVTPVGNVAWDSFAYVATRADTNQTLLPSEPHQIGINVNAASLNAFGDFVWNDSNNDGLQNNGETGINGVIVRLYTSTGTLVGSTVSGNDFLGHAGYYSFPNLPDGDYYAVFDLTTMPAMGQPSPYEVGFPANRLIDSDGDPTTGRTPTVHLAGNTTDNSTDFGIYVCISDVGC